MGIDSAHPRQSAGGDEAVMQVLFHGLARLYRAREEITASIGAALFKGPPFFSFLVVFPPAEKSRISRICISV